MPLLVEYYDELPSDDEVSVGTARLRRGMEAFKRKVRARYTEGTLQRLLQSPENKIRQAAIMALGLTGSMAVNAEVAACLHDSDGEVRRVSADALWSIWFRAAGESPRRQLQRLTRLAPEKSLPALDQMIEQLPDFAEAFNQRAIAYFRVGQYVKSITDCEKVIALNPHHFGAQAGMGQCLLKLRKPRLALKAFRDALRINPQLEGVVDTIRTLEDLLGEERGL
ncbi:MAG: tetratricopeptide repeat protein [Gemmataceae bacterium]